MSALDLHALAAMPGFGQAAAVIRKSHDPLWGRLTNDGDQVEWKVTYQLRPVQAETWSITVTAASEDDAIQLADAALDKTEYADWDVDDCTAKPA